jgi:4-amino-4-deoxychorismate lyase
MLGFSSSAPVAYPEEGIRARYCETRIGLIPALAGLKTLNRLEQVLARAELRAEDYAEGLMLDAHEHVVCGTMSNLFVVTGEKLITPDLADAGVNGIMRAQVINVAESAGIDISIQALKQAEIAAADGLFVTNSLIGMWPVAELDGVRFAPDAACIVTIRKGLAEIGVTECVA